MQCRIRFVFHVQSIPIAEADSLAVRGWDGVEIHPMPGGNGGKTERSVEALKEYAHHTILDFLLVLTQQQFVQILVFVCV